jgi:hypothetical protein
LFVSQQPYRTLKHNFPDIIINNPDIINVRILYFNNAISHGAICIKFAKTLPVPRVSNRVGKIQHKNLLNNNVVIDVNTLKDVTIVVECIFIMRMPLKFKFYYYQ